MRGGGILAQAALAHRRTIRLKALKIRRAHAEAASMVCVIEIGMCSEQDRKVQQRLQGKRPMKLAENAAAAAGAASYTATEMLFVAMQTMTAVTECYRGRTDVDTKVDCQSDQSQLGPDRTGSDLHSMWAHSSSSADMQKGGLPVLD